MGICDGFIVDYFFINLDAEFSAYVISQFNIDVFKFLFIHLLAEADIYMVAAFHITYNIVIFSF